MVDQELQHLYKDESLNFLSDFWDKEEGNQLNAWQMEVKIKVGDKDITCREQISKGFVKQFTKIRVLVYDEDEKVSNLYQKYSLLHRDDMETLDKSN